MLSAGAVFLTCWWFVLRDSALEPAFCWVEPGLGARMAASWESSHRSAFSGAPGTNVLAPTVSYSPTLLPSTPLGDPPRPEVGLAQALLESLLCAGSQCTLQEWSLCLPLSCGAPILKPPCPSKSDVWAPPPNVRLRLCSLTRAQNSYLCGRTSVIQLFSSLCVNHPVDIGFDYIVKSSLLPFCYGFFFVFGFRMSFSVGSSLFIQWLVVILVLSSEEVSLSPSTLPSCWELGGYF